MRQVLVAVVAVLFALLGPRLTMPHDREAGTPFVYEPPEGFQPTKRDAQPDETAWEETAVNGEKLFTPWVDLHPSKMRGTVEPEDLAKLAAEMPELFAAMQWKERRHETRVRADGTHVGLIEGDAVSRRETMFMGLPPVETKIRQMQLVFPTDDGTAIVTARYPTDEASKWEPIFETSIARARGVATRVPQAPAWAYASWAAAGATLGWLATGIFASMSAAKMKPRKERKKKELPREIIEEDDEEEPK